jgi:hypothetical protein
MAQLGAKLVDAGYPILPIQPGTKKPGLFRRGGWREYPAWSKHCERETTSNEVDVWGDWPEAGIGIAAGKVIGIDIDILDDPQATASVEALARQMLGDTPAVRIGHAPKRLLVYRARKPFRGFKRPPIEVLGLGQQFIVYGIHPDTGNPYHWPVETLAEIDLPSLPEITEEQAHAFITAAMAVIPEYLRPATLPVVASSSEPWNGDLLGTEAGVTAALQYIPNADLDYDSWVRIGLAIKGALGDAGWPLFEAWSALAGKNVPATTLKTWRGLKPTRIGAGTLYRLALDAGWIPDPSIQLNGGIVMNGHYPAKALLASLDSAAPIATFAPIVPTEPVQATPAGPPEPARMPPGWDQVSGIIGDMMKLMAASAKRPQPVLALGASLAAVGALMGASTARRAMSAPTSTWSALPKAVRARTTAGWSSTSCSVPPVCWPISAATRSRPAPGCWRPCIVNLRSCSSWTNSACSCRPLSIASARRATSARRWT